MAQARALSVELATSGLAEPLPSAPVDLKHLRRYTLGDSVLEKEVLDLFLAQLPTTIAALGTARTEKDWKAAAHTLKGSGRAVGAWRIACIAEQAERILCLGNPAQVEETLGLLAAAAKEAEDFVAATYR